MRGKNNKTTFHRLLVAWMVASFLSFSYFGGGLRARCAVCLLPSRPPLPARSTCSMRMASTAGSWPVPKAAESS